MGEASTSAEGSGVAGVRAAVAAGVSSAIQRLSDPTPAVADAVRRRRRARAAEVDEIAAIIDSGLYRKGGHRSPTDWLVVTTNESFGHCRSTITLATRLSQMPHVRAAFADGLLAESAARLLAETWHPDVADVFARDEEFLLRSATELPHRDFKKVLDTWRQYADHERQAAEAADRYARRSLHMSGILDGVGVIDGVLEQEGHSLVRQAIRALSKPTKLDDRTPEQRRADALVDMARITLDTINEPPPTETSTNGPRRKRNRPKIHATITYHDLESGHGGGSIDTELDHFTASADTIRRLACDAGIHRYITGPLGTVIDHGRQHRTVPDRQFDRLHIRDHGCRWPGCAIPAAGCDAHHAIHWLDHGDTDDNNLVLLCWHHHHLLHEQHWSIKPLGAGHFQLHDPHGQPHVMRPPLIGLALPSLV
jgi:hypothetical protein